MFFTRIHFPLFNMNWQVTTQVKDSRVERSVLYVCPILSVSLSKYLNYYAGVELFIGEKRSSLLRETNKLQKNWFLTSKTNSKWSLLFFIKPKINRGRLEGATTFSMTTLVLTTLSISHIHNNECWLLNFLVLCWILFNW